VRASKHLDDCVDCSKPKTVTPPLGSPPLLQWGGYATNSTYKRIHKQHNYNHNHREDEPSLLFCISSRNPLWVRSRVGCVWWVLVRVCWSVRLFKIMFWRVVRFVVVIWLWVVCVWLFGWSVVWLLASPPGFPHTNKQQTSRSGNEILTDGTLFP